MKTLPRLCVALLCAGFLCTWALAADEEQSGTRQAYVLDYLGYTIEDFEIPQDRLYTGGVPKDRQMRRENGALYEYRDNGDRPGAWVQHVDELPETPEPGQSYCIGAFTPIADSEFFSGDGEPKNGQFRVESGQLYRYERPIGWYECSRGTIFNMVGAEQD